MAAKYPNAIPTLNEIFNVTDFVTWVKKEKWDDFRAELRAIAVELGTLPKGASADVKTRLGLLALKANVLELDNVNAFTPDADYEPATKKYVDDAAVAGFTDRGDPAAVDYTKDTLSTDGAYHDMDLSAIVPAGAKAILLRVNITDDLAVQHFLIRKKSNSNIPNSGVVRTQIANVANDADLVVACDENRVVEYTTSNTTFTTLDISIKGWWM